MSEDVKTLREAAASTDVYGISSAQSAGAFSILCRVVADMIEREAHDDAQLVGILAKQEPLGADFEKVWDENRSTLYETDPTPDAIQAAEDRGWNAAIDASVAKLESTLKHYLAANPSANHIICAVLNQEAGALRRLRRTERGEG